MTRLGDQLQLDGDADGRASASGVCPSPWRVGRAVGVARCAVVAVLGLVVHVLPRAARPGESRVDVHVIRWVIETIYK